MTQQRCGPWLAPSAPDAPNLRTALAEAEDEESIAQLATLRLDSCVCLNVLEHVRNDSAALWAMARAIRPGRAQSADRPCGSGGRGIHRAARNSPARFLRLPERTRTRTK